jgi:hypothetical protein
MGDNDLFSAQRTFDLRDYSPAFKGKNGGVKYCRNDSAIADFIDYGKMIVFTAEYGEASVTAALQLASQKWGSVVVNGSDEYKRFCVRLAAKHNIKIFNPELKADYDSARETFYRSGERASKGWSR